MMSKLQETLKKAIEGIDANVSQPECTDASKETIDLMRSLQVTLKRAFDGIDANVSHPECTVIKNK